MNPGKVYESSKLQKIVLKLFDFCLKKKNIIKSVNLSAIVSYIVQKEPWN